MGVPDHPSHSDTTVSEQGLLISLGGSYQENLQDCTLYSSSDYRILLCGADY